MWSWHRENNQSQSQGRGLIVVVRVVQVIHQTRHPDLEERGRSTENINQRRKDQRSIDESPQVLKKNQDINQNH